MNAEGHAVFLELLVEQCYELNYTIEAASVSAKTMEKLPSYRVSGSTD
jgi:hypothetical protein